MTHCGFQCPIAEPIVCDPIVVVKDYYYPQIVPIIHTVQVVKRHHCVPVPKHIYNTVTVDEGSEGLAGVSAKKEGKKHANISKSTTKIKSKSKSKSKK